MYEVLAKTDAVTVAYVKDGESEPPLMSTFMSSCGEG